MVHSTVLNMLRAYLLSSLYHSHLGSQHAKGKKTEHSFKLHLLSKLCSYEPRKSAAAHYKDCRGKLLETP